MRIANGELFGVPGSVRTLRRGELLFRRGETVAAVFTVETGRLRLERALEDGTPVALAVFGSGDSVAEAALFSSTYHCDARAEVESRVVVYPKEAVLNHLESEPEGLLRLVRHLAGQVRHLRALLELRSIRRAEERVLAYLDLLELFGEGPDPSCDGRRPATALAAQLGLTPEALYRALGRLEKAGQIRREGRRILRAKG